MDRMKSLSMTLTIEASIGLVLMFILGRFMVNSFKFKYIVIPLTCILSFFVGIAKISDELSGTAENASNIVQKSVSATVAQEEMITEASKCFHEMNQNMNTLMEEIQGIAKMLDNLAESNNQIVDNITNLSATTEEVTASSNQATELSVENLKNAEDACKQLSGVLEVSHQFDKYLD